MKGDLKNTNTASFLEEGDGVLLTAEENRIKIDFDTASVDEKIEYLLGLITKLTFVLYDAGIPVEDEDLLELINDYTQTE